MPWYIYLFFEIIYLKILIGGVYIIKYKHLFDMLVETRNSFGWDTKEKALVPRQSRVAEDQIESFFEERNHIMPLTTISNNQLWKINTELCYSLKFFCIIDRMILQIILLNILLRSFTYIKNYFSYFVTWNFWPGFQELLEVKWLAFQITYFLK